jgi:SulP family sulfate permease
MRLSFRNRTRDLALRRANLKADFVAGLTFAIVSVPQAMAHALLAAVNPVLGIYTLMVAVPVAAVFTSSVFMNVSTTAALSVVAGDELAAFPVESRLAALAALVLLVGLFQIAAGLLRLGFILRFVSDAVMTGFLNGVAVLIILGQLGALTGYQSLFSNNVARTLDLLLNIGQIDLATTLIGGLTIALIVGLLRTRLRRFAFVVAIAVATMLLAVLSFPTLNFGTGWQTVEIVRDIAGIPRDLPQLTLPTPEYLMPLLLPALSVAIIGLVQGAGVGQAYPNPDGKYPDVSGDFLGQGIGNVATSLVGGLPAGGSISGTVLVLGAGAQSRWTNIFGGLCVVLVVLLAAPLAELVPMAGLAALLIVAGYQGLRIQQAQMIWNTSKISAAAMVLTFLATLFLPLHYAVLLGVVFSLLLHVIGQANQVKIMQLALVPGGFPEERPAPETLPSEQFTALYLSGSLFFAAAKTLEQMLPSVDDTRHAVVALILRGHPELGSTFLNVLQRYHEALQARDSKLMLVGVDPAVHDQLARTGLLQTIGEENVFLTTPQIGAAMNAAAAAAHSWLGQSRESIANASPTK